MHKSKQFAGLIPIERPMIERPIHCYFAKYAIFMWITSDINMWSILAVSVCKYMRDVVIVYPFICKPSCEGKSLMMQWSPKANHLQTSMFQCNLAQWCFHLPRTHLLYIVVEAILHIATERKNTRLTPWRSFSE